MIVNFLNMLYRVDLQVLSVIQTAAWANGVAILGVRIGLMVDELLNYFDDVVVAALRSLDDHLYKFCDLHVE